MVFQDYLSGERPTLVVSKDFESIGSSISWYADTVVWPGPYTDVKNCYNWLKAQHKDPVIAQWYMNPFDRAKLTESYQLESWRVSGRSHDYGKLPLVLKRDLFTEEKLVEKYIPNNGKKTILYSLEGMSSPFHKKGELEALLKTHLSEAYNLVNLWAVRSKSVVDLLGLMDKSSCLLTIDTMAIHLAKASTIPLVALVNNGWFGSIPRKPSKVFTYSEADKNLECVIYSIFHHMANSELESYDTKVYHVCSLFGSSDRHQRAQKTWPKDMGNFRRTSYPRDSAEIYDRKRFSYIKEVLAPALSIRPKDIIIWTNDDIGFTPGLIPALKSHLAMYGAVSMRRDHTHVGRDLFAFTQEWLGSHWDEFPDYFQGTSDFDLGIAAMIRNSYGIKPTTLDMLCKDFFPAELPPMIIHEDHKSHWEEAGVDLSPSVRHNRKMFMEWSAKYSPTKFHQNGIIK